MAEELKVRSIRLSDDVYQKLKEITDGIQGNQQKAMQTLINAYYMQEQKAALPDYKASLDEFESYTTSLLSMYTQALQAQQDTRQSVLQEFEATIKSKDDIIKDLQSKLTTAKQLQDDATMKARAHADENARLNSVIASLTDEYNSKTDDMQSMLSDKDKLNKALTDSCNDFRVKIEGMKKAAEQSTTLQKELDRLGQDHEKAIQEYANLKRQMLQEQTTHEKSLEHLKEQLQIAQDKAILKIEKAHQEQIEKLKADRQAEIDRYQQKYLDLLEQMQNKSQQD